MATKLLSPGMCQRGLGTAVQLPRSKAMATLALLGASPRAGAGADEDAVSRSRAQAGPQCPPDAGSGTEVSARFERCLWGTAAGARRSPGSRKAREALWGKGSSVGLSPRCSGTGAALRLLPRRAGRPGPQPAPSCPSPPGATCYSSRQRKRCAFFSRAPSPQCLIFGVPREGLAEPGPGRAGPCRRHAAEAPCEGSQRHLVAAAEVAACAPRAGQRARLERGRSQGAFYPAK